MRESMCVTQRKAAAQQADMQVSLLFPFQPDVGNSSLNGMRMYTSPPIPIVHCEATYAVAKCPRLRP